MDHRSWQLPVKRVATREKIDRSVVWNNTHVCYEHSLFGQVNSIHYNHSGSQLGCVSTNHVLLLRVPHSDGAVWNEQASRRSHSIRFRSDDKLTIQAVELRVVLRSPETAFERQVQGHTRDVRDALFLDRQTFASGSDDNTVRVWDMTNQAELAIGRQHTDYVRSLALHSEGCFYSGSYDHTVMLWDARAGLEAPMTTLRPTIDAPIEQILFVPERSWVVSSSSDVVTVYDTRSSQVLAQGSLHTKAVTALAYSTQHQALVTGGLDHRVVFSTVEGRTLTGIASKKMPFAVTALAMHPESTEFAVGMGNGLVQVSKVEPVFAAGNAAANGDEEEEAIALPGDEVKQSAAERYEDMLKRKIGTIRQLFVVYQYHKALKSALYSRIPDVIISTLEELQRRGALHVALSGHTDRTIVQLLRFVTERLENPQLTNLLLATLDFVFDIYAEVAGKSAFFHRELLLAHRRLGETLRALRSMENTIGIMEMIVSGGEVE
jgi:U3 small nucleolar RNA-associated protein 15